MPADFDTVIDRRGTGSSKWSRYPDDVLPLWVADMDFAVAPEIIAAITRRLEHPVLGYSIGRDALRARIVEDLAARYGWTIAPEEIVFLPGVEPGFNMALKAFLRPGDGVTIQTPMYRPILNAPGHWGLRRIDTLLADGGGDRVEIDMEATAAALAASRAFLFCNPHNPTGKVFTRHEVEQLAALCLANDVLIISDEIHCDLLFDGRTHIPMATLGPEVSKSTITLMSASKTYNIAGLKTAFAIIADPRMRARFTASRLGMVDSVNVLGLEATLAAYADAGAWKDQLIAYLQANRDFLADAVANRLPGITMKKPEATFLAWLDCRGLGLEGDPQAHFLTHAKVGLSAGPEFGLAGFARLNYGCPRRTLEQAIGQIAAVI